MKLEGSAIDRMDGADLILKKYEERFSRYFYVCIPGASVRHGKNVCTLNLTDEPRKSPEHLSVLENIHLKLDENDEIKVLDVRVRAVDEKTAISMAASIKPSYWEKLREAVATLNRQGSKPSTDVVEVCEGLWWECGEGSSKGMVWVGDRQVGFIQSFSTTSSPEGSRTEVVFSDLGAECRADTWERYQESVALVTNALPHATVVSSPKPDKIIGEPSEPLALGSIAEVLEVDYLNDTEGPDSVNNLDQTLKALKGEVLYGVYCHTPSMCWIFKTPSSRIGLRSVSIRQAGRQCFLNFLQEVKATTLKP